MRHLMMTAALVCSAASPLLAQGRGARQGGPGGGGAGQPFCIDPADVDHIEMLQGAGAVAEHGAAAANGVALVYPKPGVGVSQLLSRCPGLPGDDPLGKYVFSAELILANQQAINLTDAQRTAIRTLIVYRQTAITTAQLQTNVELERLQAIMNQPLYVVDGVTNAPPTDEARALEQLDRVLAAEREVKRLQLGILVRLKNLLTPQQQDALARLRPDD